MQHVKASISSKFAELGVEWDQISGIFDNIIDPFEGIDTGFLQEKYFKESLGLVVSAYSSYVFILI